MRGAHRYELKFLVDLAAKEKLLKRISKGLCPDPHGEDGVYRVSSQYFDSPGRRAYWEKLDGVPYRSKYRLRFYGQDLSKGGIYFEIKHRADQTVCKERIALKPDKLATLLSEAGALSDLVSHLKDPEDAKGETFHRISRAAAQDQLEGAVIITYLREAWLGLVDHRLRVTFDHLCQAYPPGDPFAPMSDLGIPFLAKEQLVLEVKFDRRLPVWLRDALSEEAIRPIRFSKYAEGLQVIEPQISLTV